MIEYKSLKPYFNHKIEDMGGEVSEDFKKFARTYKRYLNRVCKANDWELVIFYTNHYYCSWFIENEDGKFVYGSFSDVRYFDTSWHKCILIRTAKHNRDFTGGPNNYTNLERFETDVKKLMGR